MLVAKNMAFNYVDYCQYLLLDYFYSHFNKELRQLFLAMTKFQQKSVSFLFEITITFNF